VRSDFHELVAGNGYWPQSAAVKVAVSEEGRLMASAVLKPGKPLRRILIK
jgi:hypothetical protein